MLKCSIQVQALCHLQIRTIETQRRKPLGMLARILLRFTQSEEQGSVEHTFSSGFNYEVAREIHLPTGTDPIQVTPFRPADSALPLRRVLVI